MKNLIFILLFISGIAKAQTIYYPQFIPGGIQIGDPQTTAPKIVSGAGTPEGIVTARIGSLFLRNNGTIGTIIYTKVTGAGNTGWMPLAVRHDSLFITVKNGLTYIDNATHDLYNGYGIGSSQSSSVKVNNPSGGLFKSANALDTGSIKITLPPDMLFTMLTIKGTVYDYGTNDKSFSFIAAGYLYSDGWRYVTAIVNGADTVQNYTFRFNNAGDNSGYYVYIGELNSTWRYAGISIDEIQASFTGATLSKLYTGWSIGFEKTAFSGTNDETITNSLPAGDYVKLVNKPGYIKIVSKPNAYATITPLGGSSGMTGGMGGFFGTTTGSLNYPDTFGVGMIVQRAGLYTSPSVEGTFQMWSPGQKSSGGQPLNQRLYYSHLKDATTGAWSAWKNFVFSDTTLPTDGKLLIGRTDGTWATNNLTGSGGITITNGNGTVNIDGAGGGGGGPETDPIAIAKTITLNAGTNVSITGTATQSLNSNPSWTINSTGGSGGGITALTGDVTASGTGSVAATLSNTGVTPDTYTSADITVDAKGRILSASNGSGSGSGSYINNQNTTPQTANFLIDGIGNMTTGIIRNSGKLYFINSASHQISLAGDNATVSNYGLQLPAANGTLVATVNGSAADAAGNVNVAGGSGGLNVDIKTSNYTLALGDANTTLIGMNLSAANQITVPPNSSVAFPIGSQVTFYQAGTGETTINPGSGVTLQAADGNVKTRVRYSTVTLIKTSLNGWLVTGDIE